MVNTWHFKHGGNRLPRLAVLLYYVSNVVADVLIDQNDSNILPGCE